MVLAPEHAFERKPPCFFLKLTSMVRLGDLVWGETKSVPCITFRTYRV